MKFEIPRRYEVNPDLVPKLEAAGLQFVGRDETGERMEVLELADQPSDHPFYLAVQYHPEFKSRCVSADVMNGVVRFGLCQV